MSDVAFTVTSRYYTESGSRHDAVAAWQTAREYAIKECFNRYPKEPVTVTVGNASITAVNRTNLVHKVDQQIRAAKR